MKNPLIILIGTTCLCLLFSCDKEIHKSAAKHEFNGTYSGEHLNRLAFPLGGIGAGMVCLEGTGCLSHVSVRNKPELNNEPQTFAAITVKGEKNVARVIEGPIPEWKILGKREAGNGLGGTTYGLPRFDRATFKTRFPFADIKLSSDDLPLDATITGWSPFIPGDEDNSSLPAGALEYTFQNTSGQAVEALFSFNTVNFMRIYIPSEWGSHSPGDMIRGIHNGIILHQSGITEHPEYQGDFAVSVQGEENVIIDHCWFRGGWFDPLTMAWKNLEEMDPKETPVQEGHAPGASLYVPFKLEPGENKTIRLQLAWYAPHSDLSRGGTPEDAKPCCGESENYPSTYAPWYATNFSGIQDVVTYWSSRFKELKEKSTTFSNTFYAMDLPPEVMEAVAANLTILKSPTVLRQHNGKLWCWEGCHEELGCCHGSCTHVWNYAQAISHLFPKLERSLRETEFCISQNEEGHQTFRTNLPISPTYHNFYAAADGQLGGIMKVYREWRVSGDTEWLRSLWPSIRQSMHYCIETWDPKHKGALEEPHHNTYDIEFWGPDGMCTSFYLGALQAMIRMGEEFGDDVTLYRELVEKGGKFMEDSLYNGEYFFQIVRTKGLETPDPVAAAEGLWNVNYSPEALDLLKAEGPKYQYGNGCISDGVLGFWMARVCGIDDLVDRNKIEGHLASIHKYNLKHDLTDHVNPQRPGFAMGDDGGLLLCTWPHNDQPSLPFVYSNEVWTGIEYQVASHLLMMGRVEEGLEIVRICRERYDGTKRNPFDEYECGHWYARAMSSYGLLQGLTGVRYDAVDKILYIDSQIGENFTSFLATETGFGNVGLRNGEPFLDVKYGDIPVDEIINGR
jgi:uncharacterized protein (DUF608 family)